MSSNKFEKGNLVLYKIRPAVVTDTGEKITIQIEGGKAKRVRDKDIALLHPGPVTDVNKLNCHQLDTSEAWELLDGETCTLSDLCELVTGDFTAEMAWSVWQCVCNGVHFEGSPEQICARSKQAVDEELEKNRLRQEQEEQKKVFYENIKKAQLTEQDRKLLSEVEMLATGINDKSQILRDLDVKQTPEAAHLFLVNCGYWTAEHNPYPARNRITLDQPDLPVAALPDEQREDLQYMPAFAIDDEGSTDPDDAISLHDGVFWVHVADVASLVAHESELDQEAGRRAANLYIPEQIVHMLPEKITHELGLGLQETSPALSIGFKVLPDGELSDIRITPSLIKATRMSYQQADDQLDEMFSEYKTLCDIFRKKRLENHAAQIDLPEASIRVRDDEIIIKKLEKLDSRQMITDAMLMAGSAVAQFCEQNGIAIPYASQPEPEEIQNPQKPSEMFAYRRQFKASTTSLEPEAHFGLGLKQYTRATSPLRRYLDLVVHQQVRGFVTGKKDLLSREQLAKKILSVDQRSMTIRRTERASNMHWKLVFLARNPNWEGEAIVVNIEERKTTIIIPELALEVKIRSRDSFKLDDTIKIRASGVDIPEQAAFFQCLD